MGSISSKYCAISAHSFYGVTSAKVIGECGICGDGLVSGQNQVYTICEHLFCISCLLKWCKRCQDQGHDVPTCPLCRDPLYNNDEANEEGEDEAIEEGEDEEAVEYIRRQPTFTSNEDR